MDSKASTSSGSMSQLLCAKTANAVHRVTGRAGLLNSGTHFAAPEWPPRFRRRTSLRKGSPRARRGSETMKAPMLLALALAATAANGARTAETTCPVLPSNSGVTWSYREGPDFDVCYALAAKSKVSIFGVYLGNWPQFDPDK